MNYKSVFLIYRRKQRREKTLVCRARSTVTDFSFFFSSRYYNYYLSVLVFFLCENVNRPLKTKRTAIVKRVTAIGSNNLRGPSTAF